jgi:hypothetical protein
MPVRDLAPALLALGDVFAEASRVLYPDNQPVALDIRATNEGSFNVLLVAHGPDLWDQIVRWLSSQEATALDHLKELVIVSGASVLYLIKRLRGRKIKREEQIGSGQVRLTLDDETQIEVPAETLQLYRRVTIRKKAKDVVRPLNRKGVNRLDFREGTETTLSIEADDVSAFEVVEAEAETVLEDVVERRLKILSVVFTEGNKWRFTDGDVAFSAAIEDTAFLERVKLGEAFSDGDVLRCRMREVQSESEDGKLSTDRFIVEVLEHIPRPQRRLDEAQEEDG